MKLKLKIKINLICIVTLAITCRCNAVTKCGVEVYPTELLSYIQYADLAGVATITSVGETNKAFEVEVKQWWLGSLTSNRFEIANIDIWDLGQEEHCVIYQLQKWLPISNVGLDIVFYAMTNEWKETSSLEPRFLWFDWNFAQSFTNFGPVCFPTFVDSSVPTMFLVDTNSNFHVNILSNITQSIFISRDRMQLYRALRDAWGVEGKKSNEYAFMAWIPLRFMMYNENFSEPNYVEMKNDPLLYPWYRTNALNRLISDFGWSPTNTVPVP